MIILYYNFFIKTFVINLQMSNILYDLYYELIEAYENKSNYTPKVLREYIESIEKSFEENDGLALLINMKIVSNIRTKLEFDFKKIDLIERHHQINSLLKAIRVCEDIIGVKRNKLLRLEDRFLVMAHDTEIFMEKAKESILTCNWCF